MPDEIARLSEALARDPAGMGWVALADALRRARRLPAAERTAVRGLERHPYHADGHDVLARIAADGGDTGRARDEWEMALRLEPRHIGARLGLGWLAHRIGDREAATRWWQSAHELSPTDPRVAAAGRQLHAASAAASQGAPSLERTPTRRTAAAPRETTAPTAPVPAARTTSVGETSPSVNDGSASSGPPDDTRAASSDASSARSAHAVPAPREDSAEDRSVFGAVTRGGAQFALLVDSDGLVLAGHATVRSGSDRGDTLAAELSGLSAEARGALRQLDLGAWEHLLVECEASTLALAPGAGDTVMLVATPSGTPAGLPRLLLDRARQRANAWMDSL